MFKSPPKPKPGPRTPTLADAGNDSMISLGRAPSRLSGISTSPSGLSRQPQTQKRTLIGGSS